MLKALRGFWKGFRTRGRARHGAQTASVSRFRCEALEPRLLLSSDSLVGTTLSPDIIDYNISLDTAIVIELDISASAGVTHLDDQDGILADSVPSSMNSSNDTQLPQIVPSDTEDDAGEVADSDPLLGVCLEDQATTGMTANLYGWTRDLCAEQDLLVSQNEGFSNSNCLQLNCSRS